MKIIISEKEYLNIEFPNEMSIQELTEKVSRLNQIVKVFGRDFLTVVNKSLNNDEKVLMPSATVKRHYRPRTKNKNNKFTKEDVIYLMKVNYFGDDKQKEALVKKYNSKNWLDIQKSISLKAKHYKVKPSEVGLKRFRTIGDPMTTKFLNSLKL